MGNIVINNVTFRVKKVLGDGNCFFRCMQDSVAIKLNLHHKNIRHLAVEEVGNNKAVYAQQLTSIQRQMESIKHAHRAPTSMHTGGEAPTRIHPGGKQPPAYTQGETQTSVHTKGTQ